MPLTKLKTGNDDWQSNTRAWRLTEVFALLQVVVVLVEAGKILLALVEPESGGQPPTDISLLAFDIFAHRNCAIVSRQLVKKQTKEKHCTFFGQAVLTAAFVEIVVAAQLRVAHRTHEQNLLGERAVQTRIAAAKAKSNVKRRRANSRQTTNHL